MNELTPSTGNYDGYHKYDRQIAGTYEADREVEAHWSHEEEFVQRYLRSKQIESLLDLPVGTGRFFRHYHGVANIVGVDVSEEMLAKAREKLSLLPRSSNVELLKGDVFALPFADDQFEVTIVWRLLHLIPPTLLPKAIAELTRVTRAELTVQTYVPANRLKDKIRRRARRLGMEIKRRVVAQTTPNRAESLKPWSHIQSYLHDQAEIDGLFRACGYRCSESFILARYEESLVGATIYKKPEPK
jgi:ubiquinone/menaquinone biosynthesis C-methylase UbiE